MAHDDIRRQFTDWTPDREDVPEGIRGLKGDGTMPIMRDPEEDEAWQQACLPGDEGTEAHRRAYEENEHSLKSPSELRALLNDPRTSAPERKRVAEAFLRLQRLEGGGRPG